MESKHNFLPFIDQIGEGIKLFGLMDAIKKAPKVGLDLLSIEGSGLLKFSFDEFQNNVTPKYHNENGSNLHAIDINVYKAFLAVLEVMFHDGVYVDFYACFGSITL